LRINLKYLKEIATTILKRDSNNESILLIQQRIDSLDFFTFKKLGLPNATKKSFSMSEM